MAYTEIKQRNNRKYYYRVISERKGNKVTKLRKYLGINLSKKTLINKQKTADKELKKTPLEKIRPKIIKILKNNNVKKAGIFGSYARGNIIKTSDIDIVIEPPKNLGFEFVKIQTELQDTLRKKVDLITYNSIHPLLKKRILSEEISII